MDVVESAEATSPTEVKVTLSEPSNSWLFKMTTRIGAMFSETGVDDLANTPIGTGPYIVRRLDPRRQRSRSPATTTIGAPSPTSRP